MPVIHVIRSKKTGAEIDRFIGMNERAYRGLLMKVDSKRFTVEIHSSAEKADQASIKAVAFQAKPKAKKKKA